MIIAAPNPAEDRNPVRNLRRYMRDKFGAVPFTPADEALLYELEEYCEDLETVPRWYLEIDLGGPT